MFQGHLLHKKIRKREREKERKREREKERKREREREKEGKKQFLHQKLDNYLQQTFLNFCLLEKQMQKCESKRKKYLQRNTFFVLWLKQKKVVEN